MVQTMTEHYGEGSGYVESKSKFNQNKCHFRCTNVPFFGKSFLDMGYGLIHAMYRHLQMFLHQSQRQTYKFFKA